VSEALGKLQAHECQRYQEKVHQLFCNYRSNSQSGQQNFKRYEYIDLDIEQSVVDVDNISAYIQK
jgi:hypothetical protein